MGYKMKIEIRNLITHEVIKTVDCHERSERQTVIVENGININLDHNQYYTAICD